MDNLSVSWGSSIKWASFYRRNNKTGAIKNVQCFPDHFNGVHKDAGFCGQSILINVICDVSLISTIHIMGEFCLEENAKSRFPVGSHLSIEEYESNKKNHTFFTGVLENKNADNQCVNCTFEINRELRGWHYGWTASRHRQDIDHVFIIHVFYFNEGKYDSIGVLYSPPFQIKCSRRVTTFIESRNTPKAFKKMLPKPYNPNEKYNQFIPHNKDINDNQECLYDGLNRFNHDEPGTKYPVPINHMNITEIQIQPSPPVVTKRKVNQKRKIDRNNLLLVYASQNNHKKKMKVLKPPPLIPITSLSQNSSPLETDHKMILDIKSEPPSPISLPPPPPCITSTVNCNNNYDNKMPLYSNFNSPTLSLYNNNNSNNSFNSDRDSSIQTSPPIINYDDDDKMTLLPDTYSKTISKSPSFLHSPTIPLYSHFNYSLCINTDDMIQPPPPSDIPPPPVTPPPYFHSLNSPPPLSLLQPSRSISPTVEPSMLYDGPVLSDDYADSHSFVPLPPPTLSPMLPTSSSMSSIISTNSESSSSQDNDEVSQSAFFNNNDGDDNSNSGTGSGSDNLDWNSFSLTGDYEESRFIFTPPSLPTQNSPNLDYIESQFLQSSPPISVTTLSSSSSCSSSSSLSFIDRRLEEYKMMFHYFIFLFLSTIFVTMIVLLFKGVFKYLDYKLLMIDKDVYLYLLVFMVFIGILHQYIL